MGLFDFLKPKQEIKVTYELLPGMKIITTFANMKLVKRQFYADPEKRYWEDFDNDLEYEHPHLITNLVLVNGKVSEIEFLKQYVEF